jgi:RNA polymerase sigma-70 factor (ECF subfamily)
MSEEAESEYVKLLTEQQSVLRAFIVSLLPGAPGVDDVIQETNSILWRKRADFVPGTNFKAWMFKIARFQVMGYRRVLKRSHWVTLDHDISERVADEVESRVEAKSLERRIDALRACMEKLRETDRDLLMERYWRKTRLQDFAVVSGRSFSGLKVQLFRLRTALKRCVSERLANENAS